MWKWAGSPGIVEGVEAVGCTADTRRVVVKKGERGVDCPWEVEDWPFTGAASNPREVLASGTAGAVVRPSLRSR